MRLPKKKAVKAAVAGLAASAMLLTAMPAYAGIGSGRYNILRRFAQLFFRLSS